jgi:heme-degrading monooxygenase HmoA
MSELYTSGRWTVVPGREEDFVKAWKELAEWTSEEIPGSSWATLLQHREERNVFLSFGPWESEEAIAAWRESPGFKDRVSRIRGVLEGFEPGVFDLRVRVGAS